MRESRRKVIKGRHFKERFYYYYYYHYYYQHCSDCTFVFLKNMHVHFYVQKYKVTEENKHVVQDRFEENFDLSETYFHHLQNKYTTSDLSQCNIK